eukprot:IDg12541t1
MEQFSWLWPRSDILHDRLLQHNFLSVNIRSYLVRSNRLSFVFLASWLKLMELMLADSFSPSKVEESLEFVKSRSETDSLLSLEIPYCSARLISAVCRQLSRVNFLEYSASGSGGADGFMAIRDKEPGEARQRRRGDRPGSSVSILDSVFLDRQLSFFIGADAVLKFGEEEVDLGRDLSPNVLQGILNCAVLLRNYGGEAQTCQLVLHFILPGPRVELAFNSVGSVLKALELGHVPGAEAECFSGEEIVQVLRPVSEGNATVVQVADIASAKSFHDCPTAPEYFEPSSLYFIATQWQFRSVWRAGAAGALRSAPAEAPITAETADVDGRDRS